MEGLPSVYQVANNITQKLRDDLGEMGLSQLATTDPTTLIARARQDRLLPKLGFDPGRQHQARRTERGLMVELPVVPNLTLALLARQPLGTSSWAVGMFHPAHLLVEPKVGWLGYPSDEHANGIQQTIGLISDYMMHLNTDIESENKRLSREFEEVIVKEIAAARHEVDRRRKLEVDAGIRIIDQS